MHPFYLQTLNLLDTELDRIQIALNTLPRDMLWKKVRDQTNSVGNLCLHLAGNEYQNMVSGIGGKPFIRERSAEFLAEGGRTREELLVYLMEVRGQTRDVFTNLTEDDLMREVFISYPPDAGIASFSRSLLDLVYHTTAHCSYHTGQIMYITKILQSENKHLLSWRH
ncbi:DinB family protein [Brevibacillus daliensis]|uniref:DinB family protein n=1 Tax=Brevibacillus daliensis TaxID=2892995 RepID=UPI001E548B04|nr:DinB family protein [Brevibacillus daliensis]